MITPTEWTRFKFEWLEQAMYAADLTLAARVVAFCIMQHCNMGSECGWPGIARIAKLTGISRRAVIAGIAHLEASGHLEVQKGGHGSRDTNLYIPIARVQNLHPSAAETFQLKEHLH